MKKILFAISALTMTAIVANAQQRLPLLEVFTSSTCGPCNPGNANLKSVLTSHADSTYVVIKYQQDFPGTGDPYCTAESVSRSWDYYGINSIPRMEVDGGWDQNASSFTQTTFTNAAAIAPQYKLTGTYSVSGKVVTAKVNYNVLTTVPAGAKLYVAITEKTTIKNKKSNGETQFEDVMKKMLPSQTGTQITEITAAQSGSKTLSFTFAGNYRLPSNGQDTAHIVDVSENSVEDFSNLQVVAWIQGTDKKVYQATNLKKGTVTGINEVTSNVNGVTIYPNPAKETINLNIDMKHSDNVTVNLYDLRGAIVSTTTTTLNAGTGKVSLDVSRVASGNYTCVVFDSKSNSAAQTVSISH